MVSLGQENTACCWHSRPLISSNQTMARWPSPRPIPNLLPIWHKANSSLIATNRNWDPGLILTPLITKRRLRRKPKETVLSPKRHPSSSPPSQTRPSLPNPSYCRFTPLNRCGRFPKSASRHRKRTRCHRTRFSISPCPKRSGRRHFVRGQNRFDRPSWNDILMVSHGSGAMTGSVPDHGHFVPHFLP